MILPTEQQNSLEQLKRRISDEIGPEDIQDEYRLIRFLRARNFDVEKSMCMLSNHLEWKKEFNINEIHKLENPEVLKKYFPRSKRFFDKDGDITLVFSFGTLDTKGFLKSAKKTEMFQRAFQDIQSDIDFIEEITKKEGKIHDRWNYIIDMNHFSLVHATNKEAVELYLKFMKYYEANYPERLKRAFIINASYYFYIAYAMIKPFLSQSTTDKIRIFSKDGFKEELLEHFDSDQLPAYLGGSITDPDGNHRCLSMINIGGEVPDSYYLRKVQNHLVGELGIRKFNISRLSKATIEAEVTEAGSLIQWQFETANHDISFGLLYKKTQNVKAQERIHMQRVDTQWTCEEGVYQCQESGIYILVFDNVFSWLRSKELYCRASLVLPSGEKKFLTNA